MRPETVKFLEKTFCPDGIHATAIESVLSMETILGGKSTSMAYELRDALCHIGELICNEKNPEEFELHTNEINTHLSRCYGESWEFMAEDAVLRLQKIYGVGGWWWPMLCVVPKVRSMSVRRTIGEARRLIASGRTGKGSRQSKVQEFKNAYEICDSSIKALEDAHVPERAAALVLALIAGVIGFIVALVTKA